MHTFNMMRKRLRFWLVTMMLALMSQTPLFVNAQNPQTIEVGPHFGVTSYIGELNTWKNLQKWEWKSLNQFDYDLGAVARFNYDSRWAFRLDYSYARLRARDIVTAWRPEAELTFQSKVHDLSLIAEFNFLNYYTGHPQASVSPYIFAGVSGFLFKTNSFTGDETIDQHVLQKSKSLSIPFGVGCKMSISKHLAATIEWRMHYAFTDYLDDCSGVYPADNKHTMLIATPKTDDQGNIVYVPMPIFSSEFPNGMPLLEHSEFEGDPSHLPDGAILTYDYTDPSGKFSDKQQRGNAETNDWFGMINLSFTWKFVIPGNSACKLDFR